MSTASNPASKPLWMMNSTTRYFKLLLLQRPPSLALVPHPTPPRPSLSQHLQTNLHLESHLEHLRDASTDVAVEVPVDLEVVVLRPCGNSPSPALEMYLGPATDPTFNLKGLSLRPKQLLHPSLESAPMAISKAKRRAPMRTSRYLPTELPRKITLTTSRKMES